MRYLMLAASIAVLAALAATTAFATGGKDRDRDGERPAKIADHAVSFTVDNVNRSNLACPTDGREYTIRGRIVGPADALKDGEAVALYLHGLELGSFFWTLPDAGGLSFVERQARSGNVSVVIDRLGYDASGKPEGMASCLGAQADIADQIADDLRSGDYRVSGSGRPDAPEFDKVVLGGHSVGGLLSILTAHSFDDVDGIIVASYSDTVLSDAAKAAAAANAAMCATGGMRTEGGDFPGGYAPFAPTEADFRAAFFLSAPPALIDENAERRNLNPCGDTGTFAAAGLVNQRFIGEIDVPVLVIIGREDAIFPPPAGPSQRDLFTGSDDVKLVTLSPSSHAVTAEAPAPQFAEGISRWLSENGLDS